MYPGYPGYGSPTPSDPGEGYEENSGGDGDFDWGCLGVLGILVLIIGAIVALIWWLQKVPFWQGMLFFTGAIVLLLFFCFLQAVIEHKKK